MIQLVKKFLNSMNARVVIRAQGDLPEFPLVSTEGITDITNSSMIVNGEILDLGDSDVIEHGFCWSTIRFPRVSDNKTTKGPKNSLYSFSDTITGLNSDTDYFIRAYATNSFGTSYGVQKVIRTL